MPSRAQHQMAIKFPHGVEYCAVRLVGGNIEPRPRKGWKFFKKKDGGWMVVKAGTFGAKQKE